MRKVLRILCGLVQVPHSERLASACRFDPRTAIICNPSFNPSERHASARRPDKVTMTDKSSFRNAMFTGLVEGLGKVAAVQFEAAGLRVAIAPPASMLEGPPQDRCQLGDS